MGNFELLVSEEVGAQVEPMERTVDHDSVMENRIWRKLDLYILPLASMFYFLSFLVRILSLLNLQPLC
jgi:hypothetical protein